MRLPALRPNNIHAERRLPFWQRVGDTRCLRVEHRAHDQCIFERELHRPASAVKAAAPEAREHVVARREFAVHHSDAGRWWLVAKHVGAERTAGRVRGASVLEHLLGPLRPRHRRPLRYFEPVERGMNRRREQRRPRPLPALLEVEGAPPGSRARDREQRHRPTFRDDTISQERLEILDRGNLSRGLTHRVQYLDWKFGFVHRVAHDRKKVAAEPTIKRFHHSQHRRTSDRGLRRRAPRAQHAEGRLLDERIAARDGSARALVCNYSGVRFPRHPRRAVQGRRRRDGVGRVEDGCRKAEQFPAVAVGVFKEEARRTVAARRRASRRVPEANEGGRGLCDRHHRRQRQ